MSDSFGVVLDRLSRVPGVLAAMVVDVVAGVPVVAEVSDGVATESVAALTASLFHRTAHAAEGASFGRLRSLQLEATAGHVFVADAGETAVVAVAAPGSQLGLVRLEVQRAAEALT
jgi:predicted regulator of Ras-like GTPase activity (Roadblock/LC7/MglB family)